MESLKKRHIKLWTLDDEDANPEYFGKVKVRDSKLYTSLKERLEVVNVLDWSFEYWYVEDSCRI